MIPVGYKQLGFLMACMDRSEIFMDVFSSGFKQLWPALLSLADDGASCDSDS